MNSFLETLKEQRWDDHRYYHHSRINQTLHLLSATSFLCAYFLVFTDPAAAVLLAWLFGMTSRQIGHFFFEPRNYDEVKDASHEHKEEIKVGYNLRRKVVLMTIWAVSPLGLFIEPSLFAFSAARHCRGIHRQCRAGLAGNWAWRTALPHCSSLFPQGCPDRSGVDD